ncbi:hypothetical protein [Streptomyces bicolor]|nr:hypothetical protein [Streptomyces bicolor]
MCGVAALVAALPAAAFLPATPRPTETSTTADMAAEQADARQ